MPEGSGAGHASPITPLALVSRIDVPVNEPLYVADPVQVTPSVVPPLNVSVPLSDDPLTAPVTSPVHESDAPFHVPVTFAPL